MKGNSKTLLANVAPGYPTLVLLGLVRVIVKYITPIHQYVP